MKSNQSLSRRSFIKGTAAFAALLPFSQVLAACSSSNDAGSDGGASAEQQDSAAGDRSQQTSSLPADMGGVLVAYFSAQGHTRTVAEAIASQLGADIFEVVPVQPYTAEDLNWNDESSRVSTEHLDEAGRHVELETVTPDGFDSYDTVFVGYPIWWGDAAWPIDDFIEQNDFSGKTVIPFCTSSSSPIGESGQLLAGAAGTGDWQEGMRFRSSAGEDEVAEWLATL